jgi:hypothetical protein
MPERSEQKPTADAGPVERMVRPPAPMRAWKVFVRGWGDDLQPQAVTMATSRSKAHAKNHATATGVGYALKWGDFRVVRAPEFDAWFEKHGAFSWAWEHVQKMAEA